jgi:hypothetical protein
MGEFRKAHGKARELGALTASECPPTDELKPGRGTGAVRSDRGSDGRFVAGNGAARRQVARIQPGGTLDRLDAKADPAWKAARRWGQRAAAHRIAEVAQAHGGELSSGVCRLLRSASRLSADAEYLSRRAAADDNPDLLKVAAQLDAGARQAERDAWALAKLEADSRPTKPDATPWLVEAPAK